MNGILNTKSEIRYGIFGGIALVLYFSMMWLSFPREAFSTLHYYLSTFILVAFMFLAINEENKLRNREWDFREVARTGFVVYMIATIFYWVFYYMMHQFNPEIVEYQRAFELKNAKHVWPKEQLAAQLRAIKNADMSVSLLNIFTGYLKGAFSAFFLSFVLAIINRMQNR